MSVRHQIELIAIADNKANIITGINVIIISLIMHCVRVEFTIGLEPVLHRVELIIPVVVLTITSVISAVFAVLAAKPKIIKGQTEDSTSKLFFQSYYSESL